MREPASPVRSGGRAAFIAPSLPLHQDFVLLLMAPAAGAAGAAAGGLGAASAAAAHEAGAADGDTAHGLAAVGVLREGGVLHALADFKALGGLAFKLGDGFVNVGGHGGK